VDAIDVTKDPDARWAPRSWREKTWPTFTAGILKDLDTDPLAVREKFVEHELGIVRRMKAAGIPFLAGTDTPAGVDVLPGPSLHHELERLVAAGFTPAEALRTATLGPARFLKREGDFGRVAKGKIADLVLFDADPFADVRNTRKIAAVVANGRYFSREELDRILEGIAAYAATH
jgi:imidazolonepropionase-like amidohydrolase